MDGRSVQNGVFERTIADDPGARWDHAAYVPDVVVVSLGTNDFRRELGDFPDRAEYVRAYVAFVQAIRARAPRAPILLTEGPIVYDGGDPPRPQKSTLRSYIAAGATHLILNLAAPYPDGIVERLASEVAAPIRDAPAGTSSS